MIPFPIISQRNTIPKVSIASWDVGYQSIGLVTSTGDLYFSGANTYGQFGNGTQTATGTNQWIKSSMTGVQSVFMCKGYCTVIVKTDGTVWFCGRIYTTSATLFGVAGYNAGTYTTWIEITSGMPVSVGSIKQIMLGYQYTGILTVDGLLYMCGANSVGQFGNATTTSTTAFTLISFSSSNPLKQIGCSSNYEASTYSCTTVLTVAGATYSAGSNYYLKCVANINYRSSNYSSFQNAGANGSTSVAVGIDVTDQYFGFTRTDGISILIGYAGYVGSANASMSATTINTAAASTSNGPATMAPLVQDSRTALTLITLSTGTLVLRGEGYSNCTPVLNTNTAVTSMTNIKTITTLGMPTAMKAGNANEIVLLYNTDGVLKLYALNYLVGSQQNISNASFIQLQNPPI